MRNKKWDAQEYQQSCAFVYEYGGDVTRLLKREPGMRVLDLGCGNGVLTAQLGQELKALGGSIVGVDASPEMLALARKNYPEMDFRQMDAAALTFEEEFDAVFSNAVFHWISGTEGQRALLAGISRALKPGGQLVCEFGGHGCAGQVHGALRAAFRRRSLDYPFSFFFPTIGEYAPLLEEASLLPTDAFLFDRPTPMAGEDGLRRWIRMFVTAPFEGMPEEETGRILAEAEEALRPRMFDGESWIIDYVRIRLRAEKRA